MNALLELRKQMEIDFLKTKTYEEINDMFNQLNDKLKLAESEVKKFRLGAVSGSLLSFEQCLREEFLVNTQNYPKEYHNLFIQKFERAEKRFKEQSIDK